MPGPVLNAGSTVICAHGGTVSVIPTNPRVLAGGQPILLATDPGFVAACPFPPSGTPSPCVTVRWVAPSVRVRVMGQPILVQSSVGIGSNALQAPQGPTTTVAAMPRVIAQ